MLEFLKSYKKVPDNFIYLSFFEKVKAYDWTTEIIIISTILLYVFYHLYQRNSNQRKVENLFNLIKPVLDAEFGVIGCSPTKMIVKDSNTRYTSYASGRDNIESILLRFRLAERSNLLVSTILPKSTGLNTLPDHLFIEITPTSPEKLNNGVFSIVNKENMTESQAENFYFKSCKGIETGLPENFIFFTEHRDLISSLYNEELQQALKMEDVKNIFRFLAFTDLPIEQPQTESDIECKRVFLEVNIPKSSSERAAIVQLVDVAIKLVDLLVELPAYRTSTQRAVKNFRDAEISAIRKAEEEVIKEKAEAAKAEKKREMIKREANLSEKEQKKLQKKEQLKQARKQRQKMVMK